MVVARLGEIDPVERGKELVKDCPHKNVSEKSSAAKSLFLFESHAFVIRTYSCQEIIRTPRSGVRKKLTKQNESLAARQSKLFSEVSRTPESSEDDAEVFLSFNRICFLEAVLATEIRFLGRFRAQIQISGNHSRTIGNFS